MCRRRIFWSSGCVAGRELFAAAGPNSARASRLNLDLSRSVDLWIKVFAVFAEGCMDVAEGVLGLLRDVLLGRFGVDPFLLDEEDPKDLDAIGLHCLV